MNSELYNLIIGKKDKQYTINYLIKKNIINIEEITSEVIKTNDPKIIYYAAKNIEGISIYELALALTKAKNTQDKALYICYFANDINGAPIDILFNAIEKTGNRSLINDFKKNILSKRIATLQDIVRLAEEDNEEELEKNKEDICELLGLPNKNKTKTRRRLFNKE